MTRRRAPLAAAQPVVAADTSRPWKVPVPVDAVVIGGGIAGCAAAVVLAERGVRVTLLEAQPRLGGRAGTWRQPLPDGSTQLVDHGFHGFFRQYYNLRALLRRIDPQLSFLRPLPDYPIVSQRWPAESFAGLPHVQPLGLLWLLLRSPSLRLRDAFAMNPAAAVPLLAYDRMATYRSYDGVSAAAFLDQLRLPPRARAMLFDVFAHSFFNAAAEFSAAELIMMFHFYFLGNPEGLLFDVPDGDYGSRIWAPLADYLTATGAAVRLGSPVEVVEPATGGGWRVLTAGGAEVPAPHVVIATDPRAARELLDRSPRLAAMAPGLTRQLRTVGTAAPYVVARYWLAGDVAAARPAFAGVSGEPTLDSIAVLSRLQATARAWATRTGGSLVELHAYAAPRGIPPDETMRRMRAELAGLWPETATLAAWHVDSRVGVDAPAFPPGGDATRPGVTSDAPGIRLAGDWVRLGFPTALMERAAAAGMLAAGDILVAAGASPEPVWSVPLRGLLARRN